MTEFSFFKLSKDINIRVSVLVPLINVENTESTTMKGQTRHVYKRIM